MRLDDDLALRLSDYLLYFILNIDDMGKVSLFRITPRNEQTFYNLFNLVYAQIF